MAEISKNAFNNDDTISTAIFGKECYSINDNVFEDCNYLIKINDDNHIRNIGNYAFKNATSLSEATFGELIDMGSGAFEGCEKLTNIVIPNCLEIPENAFSGCSSLVDFDFRGRINIGDNSFNGCAGLTEITLTQCESIGSGAFKNCENITDVYINKSNNDIFCELKHVNAFLKNDGTIVNDDTIINKNIKFHVNSTVVKKYTENENWGYYKDYIISEIGSNQIRYETTDGKTIDLNDGINVKNTYSNGYGIITFDNDITSLNQIFTDGKERLTYIELPSSCKTIKESALSDCEGLKTIIMPNVETIENKAFENCKELTSVEMPESVTTLGEGIFKGCDNIAEFKGKFSTYGGRAIVYDNKLISVVSKDNSVTEGRIHNISEIDKNIDTLGAFCFEGCVNMRRVDIPSYIVKINEGAFANCKNLYEIHLNNSTLNLDVNVFSGIEVDYKIFVQETELEKWIDKLNPDINNLYPKPRRNEIIYYIDETINTNIISGSKIIDISNNKYANRRYFKINVSNNVVSTIFANRTNITKVITNEETIGISNGAFEGCKSLEYIYLSEQIKALNSRCFYACEKLKRIHIPSKANFGNEIFVGCKNLNEFGTYYKGYVTDDNRCYMSKDNNGYTTLMFFAGGAKNEDEKTIAKYTIPDNINIIGKFAFSGSSIINITMGNKTSKIDKYAFANCVSLKTISNWDNVNIISKYAFKRCSKLGGDYGAIENSGITLPNKLTTIGEYAFQNCESMYINGNIPKSSRTITIGKYAFDGCSNLKCIVDKSLKTEEPLNLNNVLEINECVFRGCSSLTVVNIGNYGGKIGDSAFYNCTKLKTVNNIQNNNIGYLLKLSIIGESAFKGCEELEDFILPNTLTSIGATAFENCKKYNPTIPNSVSSLGDNCFKGTGIETLILSSTNNLEKIPNGAFANCTSLTYIDIFNSKITKIGSGAFYNCENLEVKEGKEFFLPDGVTTINDSAFENCKGITYAYLPKSLRYLGNNSFLTNADNMKIYMQREQLVLNIPEFTQNGIVTSDSNPFGDLSNPNFVKKSISIFVPYGLKMLYINNEYWRKYYNIIEEYSK